jgi:hypothetical protein
MRIMLVSIVQVAIRWQAYQLQQQYIGMITSLDVLISIVPAMGKSAQRRKLKMKCVMWFVILYAQINLAGIGTVCYHLHQQGCQGFTEPVSPPFGIKSICQKNVD